MELTIHIHNIKNIEDLDITLTTEPGVYAITGENGAGKSTLLSCATYTFNRLTDLNNYLGTPQQGAYVMYDYGGVSARLEESNGRWKQKEKIASRIRKFFNNPLRGFLEGSVSFGNRFKNAGFSDFPNRNDLAQYPREVAPDFVKEGMGVILQNDIHYYDDLTIARAVTIGGNKNDVYFYTRETQEVDQFHMSTGENLLASVLGALHYKNERQQTEKCPCMVYLDEIEFGLHPAALKRLVEYFREVANTYNYAIYFSTHSLAIINEIEDENIYYLRKKNNGETKTEIEVVTPCAPAYATNMIYNLRGFDDIIIVEDEKARKIVNYIIKKEKLVNNRLVHIIHAGGWPEVLLRANEWKNMNAFGNNPQILAILDRDSKKDLPTVLHEHPEYRSVLYSFLPVQSMEKFYMEKLYPTIDKALEEAINSSIFENFDIANAIRLFHPTTPPSKNDKNGKNLYNAIVQSLPAEGKTEDDLVHFTIDFISATPEYIELRDFIKNNL